MHNNGLTSCSHYSDWLIQMTAVLLVTFEYDHVISELPFLSYHQQWTSAVQYSLSLSIMLRAPTECWNSYFQLSYHLMFVKTSHPQNLLEEAFSLKSLIHFLLTFVFDDCGFEFCIGQTILYTSQWMSTDITDSPTFVRHDSAGFSLKLIQFEST